MIELNLSLTVKKTKITSDEEAKRHKFPGSPTVRINGVDIDPAAKETTGYIDCRIYIYERANLRVSTETNDKNSL